MAVYSMMFMGMAPFGALLAGPPEATASGEIWRLHGDAHLELSGARLDARVGGGTTELATLPQALLDEARQAGVSALLLALLALATGDVDGDRVLKKLLPRVDGAAKDLMLMTVCRLCG